MTAITAEILTGQSEAHLQALTDAAWPKLHGEVVEPFRALQQAASNAGFELQIASGFRAFDRQMIIWNEKALGLRAVMDDNGQPLEIEQLSDRDKVFAILRWSALPGASRHHWGTDLDVWDCAAVDTGYQLQLVPAEYERGGPFHDLSQWLAENGSRYGFIRPYLHDCGGVAPEPWHLSYLPLAQQFEQALTVDLLGEVLASSPLELKSVVLASLDEIYARFVCPAAS